MLYSLDVSVVDEADVIMKKLRNSFETAAADDKSAPLMDNAQKVYAGMTYGKGRLTESFINDDNRASLRRRPLFSSLNLIKSLGTV